MQEMHNTATVLSVRMISTQTLLDHPVEFVCGSVLKETLLSDVLFTKVTTKQGETNVLRSHCCTTQDMLL